MTNIKSVCPMRTTTTIEIRGNFDDGRTPDIIRNRRYVTARLAVIDAEAIRVFPISKYEVVLIFSTDCSFGIDKRYYVNTEEEVIRAYRKLRKFMNKIKKMNVMDLDRYLYRNGFKPF